MCGRFVQASPLHTIRHVIPVDVVTCGLERNYNVSPAQNVLAVVYYHGEYRMGRLFWGFLPDWADKKKQIRPIINARYETLASKKLFRKSLFSRRCIIPADGFYEWKKEKGGKQPWYIYDASGKPLLFAGLWNGVKRACTDVYRSCAVITVEAAEPVNNIHSRMPAMLTSEASKKWLTTETDDADAVRTILAEGLTHRLNVHPVSKRVNNPKNNDASCIEPLPENR